MIEKIETEFRIRHGSADSVDVDVLYLVSSAKKNNLNFDLCKQFCTADKHENRNIYIKSNQIKNQNSLNQIKLKIGPASNE